MRGSWRRRCLRSEVVEADLQVRGGHAAVQSNLMGDRIDATVSMATALAGLEDAAAKALENDGQRVGGLLVAARQRSGRSLDEISHTTKISTRYLEAMDHGRLDLLPAGVYRRAMLRDYARSVGLDPDLVLQPPTVAVASSEPSGRPAPAPPVATSARTRHTAARSILPALPRWSPSLPSVALGIVVGAALATFIADRGAGYDNVLDSTAPASFAPPAAPQTAPMVPSGTSSLEIAGPGEATSGVAGDIRLEPTPVVQRNEPTRLIITSDPIGARVTVDGIGWGVTPLTIRHLPPGEKIVRVTKDGFLAREHRVNVDGTASVRVTLRPRS